MTSIVEYSIGTYHGTIKVYNVDPNDETDHVIARAKAQLRSRAAGSLPFGAESWKEITRE